MCNPYSIHLVATSCTIYICDWIDGVNVYSCSFARTFWTDLVRQLLFLRSNKHRLCPTFILLLVHSNGSLIVWAWLVNTYRLCFVHSWCCHLCIITCVQLRQFRPLFSLYYEYYFKLEDCYQQVKVICSNLLLFTWHVMQLPVFRRKNLTNLCHPDIYGHAIPWWLNGLRWYTSAPWCNVSHV